MVNSTKIEYFNKKKYISTIISEGLWIKYANGSQSVG